MQRFIRNKPIVPAARRSMDGLSRPVAAVQGRARFRSFGTPLRPTVSRIAFRTAEASPLWTVRARTERRLRRVLRVAAYHWHRFILPLQARFRRSLDGARLSPQPLPGEAAFIELFRPVFTASRFTIVSVFVFGMAVTGTLHFVLGSSASAEEAAVAGVQSTFEITEEGTSVAYEETISDAELAFLQEIVSDTLEKDALEKRIREMVAGYPIEQMVPAILKEDRLVAMFLVSIAKKESNWGKRVPVLDGEDCFNYWGYRGIRARMGTGGHTCFDSPEDAVKTVAVRIQKLVEQEKLNTPEKIIIWKCGYSCAGHSKESVRKWIADVDMYLKALDREPVETGAADAPQRQVLF